MSDSHGIARDQLRAFIERIERLEEEKKTIADDIKDVYGEAKSMGYDTKIMKKVVALRKIDDQKRTEDDLVLDTYLSALGMIPQIEMFDEEEAPKQTKQTPMAKTSPHGDMVSEVNPRLIQQVVTGMQTETGRAALIAAVDIMIEREEAEEQNRPETAASSTAARKDVPSETSEDGRHLVGNEKCQDKREEASHRQAGNQDLPVDTNSPIAPASQGEAEAPSVESVSPQADEATTGSSDANTGGEDETLEQNAAPIQAGALVSENTPATPMRRTAFAHYFPELTNKAYGDLRDSIIAIGISEPIVRRDDVILDGFCRFNIARSLGIHYPVIEYDGSDELLDVIRWQRSSRDWTPQQEAKIAKALAAEVPARAEEIFAAFHIVELPDGEVVAA